MRWESIWRRRIDVRKNCTISNIEKCNKRKK
jgi:hypothetical protein